MLTREDLQVLKAPFAVNQHEFDYNKNVYITEKAICDRIEQVDPSWSMSEPTIQWREGIGGNVCEVSGTMTINGVTRGGVGQAAIVTNKDQTNEANQAAKSAATDWLKRMARLFGVGRYLLDTPDYVRGHNTLEKWLSQEYGSIPSPSPKNGQNSASTGSQDKTPTNPSDGSENGSNNDIDDGDVIDVELVRVEVAKATNGTVFLKLFTADSKRASAFTRQIFRDRAWIASDYEMNEVGQVYEIAPPVPAKFEAKNGYWYLKDIAEFATFDAQGGTFIEVSKIGESDIQF